MTSEARRDIAPVDRGANAVALVTSVELRRDIARAFAESIVIRDAKTGAVRVGGVHTLGSMRGEIR